MNKALKLNIFISFALIFYLLGYYVMSRGNLHEDAYILFQYSKMLSHGHGIAFDLTSGPSEGATDFLWMVTLALMAVLSIDIGTAALLLNGIGLCVTAWAVIRIRGRCDLVSVSASGLLLLTGGAAAALAGFSTLAYGGLYSLLTVSILEKRVNLAILAAIVLSLFRPEGVILSFAGLFLLLLYSANYNVKMALRIFGTPVIIGLLYFIWRYHYFEMILPLPLLVKKQTDEVFEGFFININAIMPYLSLLVPLIFYRKSIDWRIINLILIGPLLLFFALLFAHQSQNICDRFQYPIILALIFSFVASYPSDVPRKITIIAMAPAFGFGLLLVYSLINFTTTNGYLNNFPYLLRSQGFIVDKIAITEAGNFPFYYNAPKMIDLVGLNSREVVLEGPYSVLSRENPEFIFVNHAGRYDLSGFNKNARYLIKDAREISLIKSYSGRKPTLIAPEAALRFAKERGYKAIIVGSIHVYFLSESLDTTIFLKALTQSFDMPLSYYDLERLTIERKDIQFR